MFTSEADTTVSANRHIPASDWMPVHTVGIKSAAQATLQVFLQRDRLKVIGSYADMITAKMVKLHSFWDWADVMLVTPAMSKDGTVISEPAVTFFPCIAALPIPAACNSVAKNLLQEPLNGRWASILIRHREPILSGVMRTAVSAARPPSIIQEKS